MIFFGRKKYTSKQEKKKNDSCYLDAKNSGKESVKLQQQNQT